MNKMGAAGASARLPMRGQGVGFRPKTPKPSICGSVSDVPCETAVWGDTGKWGVRVNDIEAAGGLRVCQCEAGGQDLSKKHETERSWLGFGRAVRNGSVG